MVRFECLNARIEWIKLKFARVRLCAVVVYGSCNDGSVNKSGRR